MSKKRRRKPKHVPQRTCVGCHTVQSKRSLVRVVRTSDGVMVDLSGKHPGRGAYLHDLRSCWEAGMRSGLARSLRTTLSSEDISHLTAYMSSLPEETSSNNESN